jgi:hypothetical protein
MPRGRLSKAATLIREANDEKKRKTLAYAKRRILRQLAKEGTITEAEAQEQYIALDVILRPHQRPAHSHRAAVPLRQGTLAA